MSFLHSLWSINVIHILVLFTATYGLAADSNATLYNGAASKSVPLKILPLGDSITFGYQSTDGNGYRKHLLDKLSTNGTAQYIGSVRSGNMTDNYNEGHPGAIITQISAFSTNSLAQRPNLILLMAGTNDMNMNLTFGAPERLASLVDKSNLACPDAVILLAQITPAGTADVEARVQKFNPRVASLAADREQKGVKIAVVDMSEHVTPADLKDALHPNDFGYAKMADVWYAGIQQAAARGWLTPAVGETVPPAYGSNASLISSTGVGLLESSRSLRTHGFPVTSLFLNSSSTSVALTVIAPTALSIPTRSPTSTSSSTSLPTRTLVSSGAAAAQTTASGASSMGGQRRKQFPSQFAVAVAGLWLLLFIH